MFPMVSTWETRKFHVVSPERKNPTLHFPGCRGMETWGFPHGIQPGIGSLGGNCMETPGFQR